MDRIRREIFDTIEDRDLDLKKIALSIGVTPRYLEYLKTGDRNLGFKHLMRLAYIIDPKSPRKMMSDWCLQLNTTGGTKKDSFEYAAITRNVDLLKQLLDTHKNSTGVLKECTIIYGLIYKYMSSQIKHTELLHNILEIKSIKDDSLQILLEVYKCIGLFQQRRFLTLPDAIYELAQRIKGMSDNLLKECFLHRLSEIATHVYLHLNDLPTARHYANIIINADVTDKTKSDALLVLGMSYLNENNDKCIMYLKQSYEAMKKTNINFLIEFALYNLHYAQLMLEIKLPSDADPALLMFEKFKNNEVTKEIAKEVIESSGDMDLITLFDGVSSEDITKLYEKYHEFVSDANLFNASIVVKEMLKRGENSAFIQSLTKLKLNTFKKGDVLFEENFISSFNGSGIINSINCA